MHSILSTSKGKLYACGWNVNGQLGIGKSGEDTGTIIPTLIESENNFTQIAYGTLHSLALTSNGKIYSWGSNRWGQLGICENLPQQTNISNNIVENEHIYDIPTMVKSLEKHKIIYISCRPWSSFALTSKGQLYYWGIDFCNNEKTKIITICAPWNYGREFILLHEIGHLIWDNLMSNDQQKKWKQIYKKTKMIKKDRQSAEEIWCHAYAASYVERPPMAYYKPEWVKIIKSV